jgi:multiple sugar transport system substrate-binding protein
MPKFLDNPNTKVGGKLASALPPGTKVGDKLIRRSVLWFNVMSMVSSQSKYQEASYLFLQWLGSSRIYSWMTANPAGYFDPFQLANMDDPLVNQTYKPYHVPIIRETIKRSVPSINYAGAGSFHSALDENLVAALTKKVTPEEAMEKTEKAWKQTVRKIGEKKMVAAIQGGLSAWPTTLD